MIKDRRRNDRRKMSRKVQLRSVDELLLSHGAEREEPGDSGSFEDQITEMLQVCSSVVFLHLRMEKTSW